MTHRRGPSRASVDMRRIQRGVEDENILRDLSFIKSKANDSAKETMHFVTPMTLLIPAQPD